ncbi:MAG: hypothetical protein IJ318_01055 [Clostridia bacterium]|nr:hypothetical protein [Clostridia bacterium]
MIVAKFGGTSVATLDSAQQIKKIVKAKRPTFVVVSAIGKSLAHTIKITDILFKIYYLMTDGEDYVPLLKSVIERYDNLAKELNIKLDFNFEYAQILQKIRKCQATKEYIVSRGEFLSAKLFAKFLNAEFLDAKDYIIFNSKNGNVNLLLSSRRLKTLNKNKVYVIGGFYGATLKGEIKTFSRGGSDITGAVIAKALNCEIYENYTDVNGVYNKNPRLFSHAQNLPILSYKTAYKMADAGNEVVHKSALGMLENSQTMLVVKNTMGNGYGTVVVPTNYVFNDLYICKNSAKVFLFYRLEDKELAWLKSSGELKQVIKHADIFYVIFEQLYIDEKVLQQKPNYCASFDCVKFMFFSNIKIERKNAKKLNIIAKKLKKCVVLAEFLAKENNFVILAKEENYNKVLNVINKYLQN